MDSQLFAFASTVRRMHEGPLGLHIDEYAASLKECGYSVASVRVHIRFVADLSRWLDRRSIGVLQLTHRTIDDFYRWRQRRFAHSRHRHGERNCLDIFLGHLRQKGVPVPQPSRPIEIPRHPLEQAFVNYLQKERGLARVTIVEYVFFIRQLLAKCSDKVNDLFQPDGVIRFVLRQARTLSPKRGKLLVAALRAFFRFLRLRGEIATNLADCVPTIPDWRLTQLPKSLRTEEVERVLAACDLKSIAGRRDQAILLLLARLGLRAGEIVGLELEDLHWETGEITIRGKGSQHHRLPIPKDVGRALVIYLRDSRSKNRSDRRVFLRAYPPFRGLANSSTVSRLVRRALVRAGLRPPRTGAHLFRHTLACQMLRRGATLSEIGEVLRHRHPDSTTIYAKVDVDRLRPLAQPWPGGQP